MKYFNIPTLCLMAAELAAGAPASNHYNVRPFKIDLESRVPRMLSLAKDTKIPQSPVYPGPASSAGIDTKVLNDLRHQWLNDFDWKKEQKEMNQFHHYLADIEGQTIHYIHEKSCEPDAIPMILIHGWPGSFLEFLPVIEALKQKAKTSTGKDVSFDVIVPSLPGFTFSSPAPANWTTEDTARIYNTLMTKVLGYRTFAVHGTDWGAAPAYTLYANYTETVRAVHLVFLPFLPPTMEQLNTTLTPLEQFEHQRANMWAMTGNGYYIEQTFQICLVLQDSPIGQLSWIGEKMIVWSDPLAGTPPSVLTHNKTLRSVSLYYLTQSFLSSVFIYFQNSRGFSTTYTKAETDAPLLLFSSFKWNVGFWPRSFVEKVGNVVEYFNHDFGGHFPGLDNPPALIGDLREIGEYWK